MVMTVPTPEGKTDIVERLRDPRNGRIPGLYHAAADEIIGLRMERDGWRDAAEEANAQTGAPADREAVAEIIRDEMLAPATEPEPGLTESDILYRAVDRILALLRPSPFATGKPRGTSRGQHVVISYGEECPFPHDYCGPVTVILPPTTEEENDGSA